MLLATGSNEKEGAAAFKQGICKLQSIKWGIILASYRIYTVISALEMTNDE